MKISESVECLVCIEEDLRRNIFTDFASINWFLFKYPYKKIIELLLYMIATSKASDSKVNFFRTY